jgi:2-iminobutanoate/2-iminopropanoate deaminase
MTRQAVSSDQAPAALGPYSQAIVAGGFVFCSGTAGIDPATGAVGGGIEAQTEQALQNLAAILNAAGASMADLVKVTIFYADVDDFARLNEVYARHMPDPAGAICPGQRQATARAADIDRRHRCPANPGRLAWHRVADMSGREAGERHAT